MSNSDFLSSILLLILFTFTAAHAQTNPAANSFHVEDLLSLQHIDRVVVSPAGNRAAVTIVPSFTDCARPDAEGRPGYFVHRWRHHGCSEIHIATADGLTPLAASGEQGFFGPHWSPSGMRLGFLSLDHNGDFHIWVWQPGNEPVRITSAPIDPEFSAWHSATDAWAWSPFEWIDDSKIVTAIADRGIFNVKRTPIPHPGDVLEAGWVAQTRGEQTTADPLHTDLSQMDFPIVSLVRIDIGSKETNELARGAFRAIRLSRESSIAMVSEVISDLRVDPTIPISATSRYRTPTASSSLFAHTRVGVFDLQRAGVVFWLDGVFDIAASWFTPTDVTGRGAGFFPPQPVWNSDGSKALFLGNSEPQLGAVPTVFIYDVETESLTAIEAGGNIVVSLAWIGETPLYAQLVPELDNRSTCQVTWCLANEAPANAFEPGRLPDDTPVRLYPAGDATAWFAHEGDLWEWTASSRQLSNLSEGRFGTVLSIDAVSQDEQAPTALLQIDAMGQGRERLMVGYKDEGLVELGSLGKADGLALGEATVSTTGRLGDLVLFRMNASDGIRIWTQDGLDGEVRELAWLNSHLSGLAQSAIIPLYYKSRRGEDLSGFLALPPSHRKDEIFPMVTYVYPNWMGAEGASRYASSVNSRFFVNRHVLTGSGYAVLIPYIPTEPPEQTRRLCEQIADAVLPAVEAAVATGYVDASAVGVMGHSYGGFTTASLMTCTDRFAAGVTAAGFYNLASYALSLKHRDRYNGHALGALSGLVETEMVGALWLFQFNRTPWQNSDVYVENSPVFNMDELSAPLMLVHGELDGVPISQAEEMYVAARRLGADLTFIRYWGEYHQLYSPANIRDFWQRTIDFFDKHLSGARTGEMDAGDFAAIIP